MQVVRKYDSYKEYLEHQKEKTLDPVRRNKWLGEEWLSKLDAFREAFWRTLGDDLSGKMCLGICARTGQEIQAFRDLGGDAIGVDLVPCPPLVIQGDMHNLPFSDNQFDIVFSNSFDHSLYPGKFLGEMWRVAKSGGRILLHLQLGKKLSGSRCQGYDICELVCSGEIVGCLREFWPGVVVLADRKISCLSSNWELCIQVEKC